MAKYKPGKPKTPKAVSPFIIGGAVLLLVLMLLSSIPSGTTNQTQAAVTPGIGDSPIKGNPYAPVTIIAFSDYECSYCQTADGTIGQILSTYSDKVRFVFRDMPLTDLHPHAEKAAEAARCAGEQGKFWEMHDALFANQLALGIGDLKSYAANLGINTTAFDRCLDSGAMSPKVQADISDGEQASIDAVPTFFINGQRVKGAQPIDTFKTIIDQELAKVR